MARPKKVTKKTYSLSITLNDCLFEVQTDNLDEAIQTFLELNNINRIKTRVYFNIEKDGKVCRKLMNAFEGRLVFKSKLYRMIFINRLIFK